MQYDRPLSAIVPSSRSARPSLPGWRRPSYAVRSAPQRHRTQLTFSSSIPPGWRRTSYAPRSAPQRHRVQVHGSARPFPSRMATTVLCSTIGPSAPSYPARVQLVHPFQGGDERLMHHDRPLSAIVSRFTVRLAHSLQDGDDRLMQYDRPLSAIIPSSRFGSPIPSRMATTVLCRTIGPSAPSYPAHVQLVHPSRVATNVLCITIGPSAPSYPVHGSNRPFPP
ncbi:unnamed protein product, partial [Cuscuta epithymum]